MVIRVHPLKKEFEWASCDAWTHEWHVHVRSPPAQGKANREIENECSRLFGAPTRIVRGTASPRKEIEIHLGKEKVEKILSRFSGRQQK